MKTINLNQNKTIVLLPLIILSSLLIYLYFKLANDMIYIHSFFWIGIGGLLSSLIWLLMSKYKIILKVLISIPIIIALLFFSGLVYIDTVFPSYSPTICGTNIYTTYRTTSLVGYQESLVSKYLFGLVYVIHDISSDRSSDGVQNFSQNYGFRYNRKNFYKEGDFEKYRDCLPSVVKKCPEYFDIDRNEANYPCRDISNDR
jgi:hypothetical protein